jgi:hypothetical protein
MSCDRSLLSLQSRNGTGRRRWPPGVYANQALSLSYRERRWLQEDVRLTKWCNIPPRTSAKAQQDPSLHR